MDKRMARVSHYHHRYRRKVSTSKSASHFSHKEKVKNASAGSRKVKKKNTSRITLKDSTPRCNVICLFNSWLNYLFWSCAIWVLFWFRPLSSEMFTLSEKGFQVDMLSISEYVNLTRSHMTGCWGTQPFQYLYKLPGRKGAGHFRKFGFLHAKEVFLVWQALATRASSSWILLPQTSIVVRKYQAGLPYKPPFSRWRHMKTSL